MLTPAVDASDFGDYSFAVRHTLRLRAAMSAPCADVSWAPIPVVATDRYAYELVRTYTEQYHDEVPHHKVQEWKTRRVAKLQAITAPYTSHVNMSDLHGKYRVPAHV